VRQDITALNDREAKPQGFMMPLEPSEKKTASDPGQSGKLRILPARGPEVRPKPGQNTDQMHVRTRRAARQIERIEEYRMDLFYRLTDAPGVPAK
jgi:hypothetical protein